jgi:putative transposase
VSGTIVTYVSDRSPQKTPSFMPHGWQRRMGSDNVFVERLWRSVKYEEVYLKAYASVAEARIGIGKYLHFYNTKRPHQALDGNTPDKAYFIPPMLPAAA